MHPLHEALMQTRRNFLATSASGVGTLAVASLLRDDNLLAADATAGRGKEEEANPLAPRPPHFAAKAKACICIYLEGGPSQMDLFDPKPKLNAMHGKPMPESMLKNVRFAFIQKATAKLLGSPRTFARSGKCGMEISDRLPLLARYADDIALIRSMYTEAFNHHPGQLLMNTGVSTFGRPSMGSWLAYGLGSVSRNLPGYVVLTSGRGTSGGTSNWSSGFLPSTYQGVVFRNKGEPILNLTNPKGLSAAMQAKTIGALRDLNKERYAVLRDPEINSRIAAYELAFRMQSAAPELIDLKKETKALRDEYGLDRPDAVIKGGGASGGPGQFHAFAANCLLARRLVERGVRFVNLYHASWDHHNGLEPELKFNCLMADQPIAALLKDLKNRGLLDTTLVIWLSEFGRTPLGENKPGVKVSGRDHHPYSFSIWMAGGGVKGGQVIGKTDEFGWGVVEEPVHVNDFHATVLHLFGLDHLKLTYRFQGRDFRLTDVAGKVVKKLLA
jgi:hypothetical protein